MLKLQQHTCRLIRRGETYSGKQGLSYFEGISAQTAGSQAICMHILEMPPGTVAKAHRHDDHETAIYMISGTVRTWYGDRLENCIEVSGGEMFYIPAGVPHVPANVSLTTAVALIARTDPNEQESVTLLPELDRLVQS